MRCLGHHGGWGDTPPGFVVVTAGIGPAPHPSRPVSQPSQITGLLSSRGAVHQFQAKYGRQYGLASPVGAAQGRGLTIAGAIESAVARILPLQACKPVLKAQHALERFQEFQRSLAVKLRALVVGEPVVLPAPREMLGMGLLIAETQVPGLLGPLALIDQCGDGGRRAGQRLGFDPRQIALMLVDLVEPAQCNQAADLSAQQRDLVSSVQT